MIVDVEKDESIELADKEYVDSIQRIHELYFGTNTTVDFQLRSTRGMAIVALTRNGGTQYYCDLVFYNNNAISGIVHLTEFNHLTYSIKDGILTINNSVNYSRGFIVN